MECEVRVLAWERGRGYTAFLGNARVGSIRHIKSNWWLCWLRDESTPPLLVEYEMNANVEIRRMVMEAHEK